MKLLITFVLATMVMSIAGLAGNASAQQVTIEASAGDNKFFGEGVLQVVVTDPDADDNDTVEDISVNIDAEPDSGSADSISITVPETDDGSGRFEFFLVHAGAVAVGPADLDAANSAGVEGDGMCAADCAPFVTFGPAGDLDIQADLYEQVAFEIVAGDVEAEVSYEESAGGLTLDRDSYGTTSFVYISVTDQDANLNPFENDEFTVDPDTDPNDDLLALDGGTFEDAVVFRETGDNSAVFEGRYRLGVSIAVDSESLVLTLNDKANYNSTLAAPENNSNNIDQISFTIGNSDGTIDVGGGKQTTQTWDPAIATDKDSYSAGETVYVTITDQDANGNSNVADSIQAWVSSGGNQTEVFALETGAATGIFEASFSIATEGDWTVRYTDERPADYYEKISEGHDPAKDFTLEIDVQAAIKTGTEATEVTAPAVNGDPHAVGSPLTISTSITNNNDQPQPFVAIIEVRDNNGVTIFLALQSGTLDPSGSADIEVLWQPESAGTFQARTFAFSQLVVGEVLSPVAVSEITVA